MSLSEFTLIARYFASQNLSRPDVLLGIGDDGALLAVPPGESLVVTLDMLVAGRHFPAEADPEGIGYKSLAVNLSDLAAMGAVPAWITLGLSLPAADEAWLAGFCRGLFTLAAQYRVQLIGGDTTRGPLTITIQAHGFVPPHLALRRDGARPGDVICVTGTLGDAALGLALIEQPASGNAEAIAYLHRRLERPTPRLRQGLDLRGLAGAAIDISDGLAQDLGHILERSGVGACLLVERLPLSPALLSCTDSASALALALAGGDDYELCFTVPPSRLPQLRTLAATWDCDLTTIGVIEAEPGLRCRCEDGTAYTLTKLGFDHFT
ncbi:MAG: thiamine-phosphate kinase [Candidatus Competibacteraceae bacterium]